jgi:hypothetical protein
MDNLKWLYTTEEVIVSGPNVRTTVALADRSLQGFHVKRPTTVKLLQFIDAEDDFGRTVDEDAALSRRLGALRHVRCRPHPEVYADEPPAYSGVRELWWPTLSAFEEGVASQDDLAEFLSSPGSVTMLAQAERFI